MRFSAPRRVIASAAGAPRPAPAARRQPPAARRTL